MGAFTNRPAVKFCMPLMIGIAIGWNWSLSARPALVALFFVSFGLSAAVFVQRLSSLRTIFAFLLIVLFGILKITFDANLSPGDSVWDAVEPGQTAIVRGTITGIPDSNDQYVRFVVEAESVGAGGGARRVSGGILASARRGDIEPQVLGSLTYGRTVVLTGELAPPAPARNPGEFDLRAYLHLNNIEARIFLDPGDSIVFGPPPGWNFPALFVAPVRRSVGLRLDRLIGGDESKFLRGLIIGDRTDIPMEIKTAFINSGVMHILAVSGLHVAIVAMILLALLQAARVPEKPRIIATCLLLVYYIFLTGGAASVIRSVIMAIVFLGGKLSQHRADFYNTLALSAIVILLIDAKQFFQPGFQLSFAAVFSLVYLYPKMHAASRFLPGTLRRTTWVRFCIAAFCVSLAAGIGTLPFTSVYFGKISLAGFVANMIVVPLSNIVLASGMLAVSVSYLWGWPAEVYAAATALLTNVLLTTVNFFGGLPFAYLNSHFTIWSSLAFYGAVGFAIRLARRDTRKPAVIALLLAADLLLYADLFWPARPGGVRATFLDIGQGDAIFLELPGGRRLLVDAGPGGASGDAGARFIEPFLRRQGIGMLDGIVLSHPHSDHLGGIPHLLKRLRVGEVIDAGSRANSSLYRTYLHLLDSLAIPRRILRAGDTIAGLNDVRLYVLHPSRGMVDEDTGKHGNLNNQSLVVKLVYGRSSLLLAGDAETEAEDRMIAAFGPWLRSDVLKAGHHGSITSTSAGFLDLVRPSMAVISVGARNKFHLPSEPVLLRLANRGVRYFRTDSSGAVVMESDGETWSVVDWR